MPITPALPAKLKRGFTVDTRYPAQIAQQDDGRHLVRFVDLADTFTEGQTHEEAVFNAGEILSTMLAWHLEQSHKVPAPSQNISDAVYISPDAKTQAALLLRWARGERSLSELARAMDTSWPAAKRLENPLHWPSLRTLDRAAAALGKRLVLALE